VPRHEHLRHIKPAAPAAVIPSRRLLADTPPLTELSLGCTQLGTCTGRSPTPRPAPPSKIPGALWDERREERLLHADAT